MGSASPPPPPPPSASGAPGGPAGAPRKGLRGRCWGAPWKGLRGGCWGAPGEGGPRRGPLLRELLAPFMAARKAEAVLLGAGALMGALSGLLLPYFFVSMGATIDNLSSGVAVGGPVKQMAVAGALNLLLQGVSCCCFEAAADRLAARRRSSFVAAVLQQQLSWFDRQDAGSLAAKLDSSLADLREGIGLKFVAIPYNLLLVVGSLAAALVTSWEVTLCAAAGLLPAVAFGALLAAALRRAAAAAAAALEAAGAVAAEALGAPRTVAAFGQEGASKARYQQHIAAAEAAAARGGLFSGLGMAGLISSVFAIGGIKGYRGAHLEGYKGEQRGVQGGLKGSQKGPPGSARGALKEAQGVLQGPQRGSRGAPKGPQKGTEKVPKGEAKGPRRGPEGVLKGAPGNNVLLLLRLLAAAET
ncbi:hypothetical protein, conserved [Eimeria necatrix]|uniref:ABC transmembrane type-1 domain-containing protein n=1 Tax=Eimeria necatrix TaxID=51315 RepID=U6MVG9_9EIME|nr:hypothetical protein, conserved [Eimeria necatrix]CDJ68011.1 hypothetical protein, conserved [Eimeria necatrix]